MPIREFQCGDCSHIYETLIFGSDDMAEERCPKCGSSQLVALFSVFGVAGVEKQTVSSKSCGSCSTHNCGSCG